MKAKRKQIRIPNFDYSTPGIYFVTICTLHKQPFFGIVQDGRVQLSGIGVVADKFWNEIPYHFSHVKLDKYVVMPDHIHGILRLKKKENHTLNVNCFSKPVAGSLSVIINQYKSSLKRYCNQNGMEDFFWQRGFYDQIIRDRPTLFAVRNYIRLNPEKWGDDKTNQHDHVFV